MLENIISDHVVLTILNISFRFFPNIFSLNYIKYVNKYHRKLDSRSFFIKICFNGIFRPELFKFVLDNYKSNLDDILMFASLNGHYEMVKLLIKYGANTKYEDSKALEFACYNGHYIIDMDFSKQSMEDFYGKDIYAMQSLIFQNTSEEKYLKNFSNGYGSKNFYKIAKILLKNGADPKDNREIITAACRENNLNVVKLLAEHGADLHEDINLGAACLVNNHRIVSFLFRAGLTVGDDSFRLLFDGFNCYKTTKLLLENGANPNVEPTILRDACIIGNSKVIKLLLKYEANSNPENLKCRCDCYEYIELLLEQGKKNQEALRKIYKNIWIYMLETNLATTRNIIFPLLSTADIETNLKILKSHHEKIHGSIEKILRKQL